MKVRVDDTLADGVLVGEHGWWQQADAGDRLTSGTNLNSICATATMIPSAARSNCGA